MTPLQLLKRALVSILLELARSYGLSFKLSRDSPDADVKKAFRRVSLKVHPDKPGGSEASMKKLSDAWSKWIEAGKARKKRGRPSTGDGGNQGLAPVGGKKQPKNKEFRIQGRAVMLTYQGIASEASWSPFLAFVSEHLEGWKIKYWTATFETNADEGLHAHLMLQFRCAQDRSSNSFVFRGIRPNVSVNDYLGNGMCGRRPQLSVDRGMFYVWANKLGQPQLKGAAQRKQRNRQKRKGYTKGLEGRWWEGLSREGARKRWGRGCSSREEEDAEGERSYLQL